MREAKRDTKKKKKNCIYGTKKKTARANVIPNHGKKRESHFTPSIYASV